MSAVAQGAATHRRRIIKKYARCTEHRVRVFPLMGAYISAK